MNRHYILLALAISACTVLITRPIDVPFTDIFQEKKPQKNIFIFSPDIDTPIYNIPLQQALLPLSYRARSERPWCISAEMYGKTNQKQYINHASCKDIDAGVLFQGGYYGSWLFVNCIANLSGTETTTNLTTPRTESFGIHDALFELGIINKNISHFVTHSELFFGISADRLKDDTVFNVGVPSMGIQTYIECILDSRDDCMLTLSAFTRFTHFFKKNITTEKEHKNIFYTPGSYFDVLLSTIGRHGSHSLEIGYYPTIRITDTYANIDDKYDPDLKIQTRTSGNVHQTVYLLWSYNKMPVALNIGLSETIILHTCKYGIAFVELGYTF